MGSTTGFLLTMGLGMPINAEDRLHCVNAVIPDRCFVPELSQDCQAAGQGTMAMNADKTYMWWLERIDYLQRSIIGDCE